MVVTVPAYILAFLIGITAGLRCFTAPAVVTWAARYGLVHVGNTWLAFLGYAATPWVVSILAVGELIADPLPMMPSRKEPPGFVSRIITGGLSGGAIGASSGSLVAGFVAGAIGAIVGTMGGYEFRVRLSRAIGKDLPIALIEDAIAVGGAVWIVSRFA